MHSAVVSPGELPYKPTLQLVHTADPATLYWPVGHCIGVGDAEPDGHAYPALQLPSHDDDVAPWLEPYRPAAHRPLHADDVSA